MSAEEVAELVLRCAACQPFTPGGFIDPAGLCHEHACPSCHHWPHDVDDGCGVPDPRTGWCECELGQRLQHGDRIKQQQAIVNYFVEEGLIPEDMSYEPIRHHDRLADEHIFCAEDRRALIREVDRLRDEIADRAGVEADLRAQLAEMQARLRAIVEEALLSVSNDILVEQHLDHALAVLTDDAS